jgi:hypothetical protein
VKKAQESKPKVAVNANHTSVSRPDDRSVSFSPERGKADSPHPDSANRQVAPHAKGEKPQPHSAKQATAKEAHVPAEAKKAQEAKAKVAANAKHTPLGEPHDRSVSMSPGKGNTAKTDSPRRPQSPNRHVLKDVNASDHHAFSPVRLSPERDTRDHHEVSASRRFGADQVQREFDRSDFDLPPAVLRDAPPPKDPMFRPPFDYDQVWKSRESMIDKAGDPGDPLPAFQAMHDSPFFEELGSTNLRSPTEKKGKTGERERQAHISPTTGTFNMPDPSLSHGDRVQKLFEQMRSQRSDNGGWR